MKMTFGGTMGFKIQGKQYESIDATAVFTLEKEFSDDVPINEETIKSVSDKVNTILTKEASKRMKTAVNEYKNNISKLKSMLK